MKALLITLRLEQPVLVSQPQGGDENSSVSHVYIPGAVLRGALHGP